VDALIQQRLLDNFSDIGQAGYNKPQELLNRHLVLNNLPDFTIVGITDKKSPCIYAAPSMFINMLANSTDENAYYEDLYGEGEDAAAGMEEGGSAPAATTLTDYTLRQDELELTKDSKWPENDYEVIVDNNYKDTIKLNKEIKTKVNGHNLKVVGYYTSDTVHDQYFVNNNMIKYQLILSQKNMTVKPAVSKEEAKAALESYGLKVRDLYQYQKKKYREAQLDLMRSFILVGSIILIISLVEIFLIMRASFLSRIKEVGTLRAIGVKKWDIYRMFAGEIVAITVCASVPGWLMMNYLLSKLQHISLLEDMFAVTPQTMLISLVVIFFFNLLFGLLPVFHTLLKRPAAILARTDVN